METKTAVEFFGEIIEYYIPDDSKEHFKSILEACKKIEAVQWDTQRAIAITEYLQNK
jgi:hypothetical protein